MNLAGIRGWHRAALAVLAAVVGLAGCTGKKAAEDEKTHAPRRDQPVIDAARRELQREEQAPAGPDDALVPAPVLFVNGDPITVEDVMKWVRPDLAQMKKDLPPDEYHAKMIELLRAEVRAQAERRVLSQEAEKRMGEQMTERIEQFVDGRIRDIVNEQHGGREARYRDWLRDRGISPEEDRDRIRRELLVVAFLQRTVGPRVAEPTRRELEAFHADYIADALKNRKRRMELIDIPYGPRDATGREVSVPVAEADARARAERALGRLREGADFGEVAREYSEGINAASGGDWGWVKTEGMRARWQPAVDGLFQLEAGAVSDVIQTPDAFFIVRCGEIEPVETPSFEEIQPKLIASFKQQQFEVLAREVVRDLFDKADVRPENPARFLLAVVNAAEGV